jgi:1-acyl-sn-glycerol-3-phosphate acyltransferase
MKRAAGDDERRGILAALFGPIVEALLPAIAHERDEDPFRRDPEFIRRVLPFLKAADWYFSAEIRGWENVPESGPFLVVGNHSGGAQPVDLWPFLVEWVERRGADDPFYALTYDLDFTYPVVGAWLRKMGLIPASRKNATRAFEQGAPVVVFPGGDYEVFRPWTERNEIEFGGRKGFVELALAAGVPVVPMTIHGAHESTFVITRGHFLAKWGGLERLHIKVFPFVWNIPLGVMPAFVPTIQLPAKVTIQIGEPIDWSGRGEAGGTGSGVVDSCYEEVTGVMQKTMDELAREDPYPILTRLGELRPDRVIARTLHRLWR